MILYSGMLALIEGLGLRIVNISHNRPIVEAMVKNRNCMHSNKSNSHKSNALMLE